MADPIFGQNEEAPGIVPGGGGVGSTPDIVAPKSDLFLDEEQKAKATDTKDKSEVNLFGDKLEMESEDHPASLFDQLTDAFMTGIHTLNETAYGIMEWGSAQIEAGGLAGDSDRSEFFDNLKDRAVEERKRIDYKPTVSLNAAISDPTLFLTTSALPEAIASSLPEMALAMSSLGGYAALKTDMIARDRSENNGRGRDPEFFDLAASAPYALGSAYMERVGLKFALGNTGAKSMSEAVRKVAESITIGSATEITQELLEYTGEHLGTKRGFDPMDAVAQASFAAYVGGATEGSINVGSQAAVATFNKAAQASRAQYKAIQIKKLQKALKNLPSDHQIVAEENFAEKLKSNGIETVSVDYDVLKDWLDRNGGDVLAAGLNIDEALAAAEATQGMVNISVDQLVSNYMKSDGFDALADHVLFDQEGVTGAEARQYFKEDINLDFQDNPEQVIEDQEMVDLGLDGMIKSADEAGMTSKEWTEYQNAKEKHRTGNQKIVKEREASRAVNKNSKKINKLRKQETQKAKEELRKLPEHSSREYVDSDPSLKLDRADLMRVVDSLGIKLSDIPKNGKRVRYTGVNVDGSDPASVAAMHGYSSASDMVVAWLQYPDIDTRAAQEGSANVKKNNPELFKDRQDLFTERSAARGVEAVNLLEKELTVAEKFAGQQPAKRNRFTDLRKNARGLINTFKMSDLNVNRFLNIATRAGRKAGVEWRKGNYREALKWKYRQLVNIHFARLVPEIKGKAEMDIKFAKKFMKKRDRFVPGLVDMQEEVLNENDWVEGRDAPYKTWSIDRINQEVKKIKEIDHKLKQAKKVQQAIDDRNAFIAKKLIEVGLDPKKGRQGKTPEQKRKTLMRIVAYFNEFGENVLHPDTIVQMVDGDFVGDFRNMIKRPYDQAMAGGYKGQEGFVPRWTKTVETLASAYDLLPTKLRRNFDRTRVVPGVRQPLTNETFIGAILNTGNTTNIDALREQRGFTDAEIKAIREAATDEELSFVQTIWDIFESFHEDAVSSQMSRRNIKVGKVVGNKFTVRGKQYNGGYYPISTVHDGNPLQHAPLDVEQELQRILYGSAASYTTNEGHAKRRKETRGMGELRLDLDVAAERLHTLVYDLEVGDAMVDIFRVLYHNDVKQAFRDKGQEGLWNQLDLFFKDAVTAEKIPNDVWNSLARRVRQGSSVVALGFKASVSAIQPLGVFNAAPVIGTTNALWHLTKVAGSGFHHFNKTANEMSKLMTIRSDVMNKEINENYQQFKLKKSKKWLDYVGYAAFFPIKIMQRWADLAVFHGAYKQRIRQGDTHVQAVEASERIVTRSQASGIFGDRSSFERGSTKKTSQSELLRLISFLMSYHIASNNIIKTKQINETSIRKAMQFAVSLTLISVPEAVLFSLLRGDDELPEDLTDVPLWATRTLAGKYAAGVPYVNMVSSALKGFPGVGPGGSIVDTIGDIGKELMKEEADVTDVALDVAEVGATFAKLPFGQFKTTINSIRKSMEGEDVEPLEYIFGVPYNKEDD